MEDYEHALLRYCGAAGGFEHGPASRIAPCLASVRGRMRVAAQCCLALSPEAADDTGPMLSGVSEILEEAAEELREAETVIEISGVFGRKV